MEGTASGGPVSGEVAPAVTARGLAASYQDRTVWAGVDFDVAPGEFIGVLGPNGAGKSTLMRLVLGLLQPSAGTLTVLGDTPRRGNPDIGYVPQRRPIDPEVRLAGAEIVKLGLTGHRWGVGLPRHRAATDAAVADAVRAVGADAYVDHPVGTLSGGELQRLLLAQAIVGTPRLLLLDEPLASLDVRNQVAVAHLVSGLARSRGLTVLLIAHDVNPLLPVLDRVMYVAAGHVTIGRPDEVITSERLSALYDAEVEVLIDSHGRRFVVGLDEETAHQRAGHDDHAVSGA